MSSLPLDLWITRGPWATLLTQRPSQPRDMRHRNVKPKLRALWPSQPTHLHRSSPPPTCPSPIHKPRSQLPPCSSQPAHPCPFPVCTGLLLKSLTCKPPLPGSPITSRQWSHVCSLGPPPSLQVFVSSCPFLPPLATGLSSAFPFSQGASQLQLAVPLFGLLSLFLCVCPSPPLVSHSAPNPLPRTRTIRDPVI